MSGWMRNRHVGAFVHRFRSRAAAGPMVVLLGYAPWLIVAGLVVWTFWPRPEQQPGKFEALPPAPEVRTVEKVVERVEFVKVYPNAIKAKLKLPDAVVADASRKLTATGKLDAEERPYTLTAILDTKTGESEILARPDPLPWVGPGRRGAIGIAYGLSNGEPTGKLYAQHDLLRVKALHAGARAEVDQRGEWWAGGYIEYRW